MRYRKPDVIQQLQKINSSRLSKVINLSLAALLSVQGAYIIYIAYYFLRVKPLQDVMIMDFFQDYFAATKLAKGQNIYQGFQNLLPPSASQVLPGCDFHDFHPPIDAVLLLPFQSFPVHNVLFGWFLISLICIAATLVMLKREFFLQSSPRFILLSHFYMLLNRLDGRSAECSTYSSAGMSYHPGMGVFET